MSGADATGLAGYMIPEHNGSEYSRSMFQARTLMANLRTMVPVRVVKVYAQDGKTTATRGAVAGAGFVDVQPVISQVDGQGTRVDHVTIYHVPYTRFYGGNAAIIMDPVVGDVGYVHAADRDISSFRDQITQGNNTLVTPPSNRRNSLSDSIYVGGVLNNAPAQYDAFSNGGITRNDVNNNQHVMNSSGVSMTAAVGSASVTASAGSANFTASAGSANIFGSQNVNVRSGSGSVSIASGAGISITSGAGGNISITPGAGGSVSITLAQPTETRLTSGSGTYTPPTGCVRIHVRMCGGGGGGGGATANNGGNGNTTTFGSWTALGGAGGAADNTAIAAGGSGGTNGTGTLVLRTGGQNGGPSVTSNNEFWSFPGGNSLMGLGGGSAAGGGAGANATGNGAGGGAGASGSSSAGSSGAGAETVEFIVDSPSAVSYSVGAAGAGGAAGGSAGGNGSGGIILIDEFYY